MIHNCDLCGSTDRTEIEPNIAVCMGCGFVYVPERRSSEEIAQDWSNVYRSGAYDPNWPGVKARLWYVAEWMDQNIGLKQKSLLDIGAGTGTFLKFARERGAYVCGLEPDEHNAAGMMAQGIQCIHGSTETVPSISKKFDLVTLNWTLENTGDCLAVLRYAREHLAPGGRVVVATGSRILVPYKKSYAAYMGTQARDLHCFRWSRTSLAHGFSCAGLKATSENDYSQNDVLLLTAGASDDGYFDYEDANEIINFFRDWKRTWP